MIKRIFFPLLFIVCLQISVFSQSDKINSIKKHYYSVTDENYKFHELILNSVLPAVGDKEHIFKFYYDSNQINPEEDVYNFEYKLIKVITKYNVSASSFHTFEYLFDKNSQLIFFMIKKKVFMRTMKKGIILIKEN